jgi:GWxTD domain-containing protein
MGARGLCGALGVALMAVVFAVVPADAEFEGLGPLPWRVGGPLGFTVDAAGFPDTTGHRLEVYVRVPPATVASLVVDSADVGRLRITGRLKSGYRGRWEERTAEIEVATSDSVRGFGKVALLAFPLKPGPQELEVRLEQRSRSRGISYLGRRMPRSARVQGPFEFQGSSSTVEASDVEFVWTHVGLADFGGRGLLPNPERLYGLHASEMRAAFVLRGAPGDERPWHWSTRILAARDSLVFAQDSTIAGAPWVESEIAVDASRIPAGGYDLELVAWREGDSLRVTRRSRFSVAWQPETWFRNPGTIEDAVHLLLQPQAEEDFALLQPGEQERFLDDFWKVRDPTPGTAVNEAHERFLSRVEHANQTFAYSTLVPGMFTDMGRVYIRYGEPFEIHRQVIPTGDNELARVILDLDLDQDRDIGELSTSPGPDTRPYEVWVYEGEIPMPPEVDPRQPLARRFRLVFLFVDDQGLGDYRLQYSTE